MTIAFSSLLLYMGALFVLFVVPGPVWVAVLARTMAGGFYAAVPLALGVGVGDIIWAVGAILGINALVAVYSDFLFWLQYGAAAILILMGLSIIRYSRATFGEDSRLNAPGMVSGFFAGLFVVIANPKACVFYLALLPSFFSLTQLTISDIILIALASFSVPLLGNLALALCVDFVRRFLAHPKAMQQISIGAGLSLIGVGLAIAIWGP